jgi:hypothetical protein
MTQKPVLRVEEGASAGRVSLLPAIVTVGFSEQEGGHCCATSGGKGKPSRHHDRFFGLLLSCYISKMELSDGTEVIRSMVKAQNKQHSGASS